MWISRILFIFIFQIYCADAALEVKHPYNYNLTTECVKNIINTHYGKEYLTFINFNSRDTGILKTIHEMSSVAVVNKKPYKKSFHPNRGYLIFALTAEDFQSHFSYLVSEAAWMPYAPFLVVVQRLDAGQLRAMFDTLLWFHVAEAVVVDGLTSDAYTYDPFENNGCGKRFDRIITLGKCLKHISFYPKKLENRLQNCTIQVAATHWPPYTIDPTKTDITTLGMDEYVFSLLSEHERFKINITYVDNISDEVSVIDQDMVAIGPLRWLQENKFDAVTGAMMLLETRATAFTFLYGEYAYDFFKIFVRQAGNVPSWKTTLLVFRPLVWLLLSLSFITIAILIILVTRTKDRSRVIFSLIDNILMHSCRIRRTSKLVDFILILWITFACLIAYHYLSVLYSITTKPIHEYQIGQLSDLSKYGTQSCLSDAMHALEQLTFPSLEPNLLDPTATAVPRLQCNTMEKSLNTVSKSQNMYTVVPYCLYYANRYKYYDEYGKNKLHSFQKPLSKILYASYMYKGFPLIDKFHLLTQQINAAGLTGKIWRDYDYLQRKRFQMQQLHVKPTVTFPWYIVIGGWFISTLCFLVEIMTDNLKSKPGSSTAVP